MTLPRGGPIGFPQVPAQLTWWKHGMWGIDSAQISARKKNIVLKNGMDLDQQYSIFKVAANECSLVQ